MVFKVGYFDFKLDSGISRFSSDSASKKILKDARNLGLEKGLNLLIEPFPFYSFNNEKDYFDLYLVKPKITDVLGLKSLLPKVKSPVILIGDSNKKVSLMRKVLGDDYSNVNYSLGIYPETVVLYALDSIKSGL